MPAEGNPNFLPNGKFAKGNKVGVGNSNAGRPPRDYSIAHALSQAAKQAETVDDDGTVLTKAQVAARWLWECVLNPNLSFRDRLEAFKTVVNRIEPDYSLKLRESQVGDGEEASEETPLDLTRLSDDEIRVALAILDRAKADGGKPGGP